MEALQTGFIGPVVYGVSPSSGLYGRVTNVTITGSGFTGTTGVTFGTTPATNVTIVNVNTITATAPPGTGTCKYHCHNL